MHVARQFWLENTGRNNSEDVFELAYEVRPAERNGPRANDEHDTVARHQRAAPDQGLQETHRRGA